MSDLSTRIGQEHRPASLSDLAERARDYAEAASSANTRRAYDADWRHFSAWCKYERLDPLPPAPQTVGLYLTACATGAKSVGGKRNAVSTIERRLSALCTVYQTKGMVLDRRDRHIALVLAGIRNTHGRPPVQKAALMPEDLIAMLSVCERETLRGLRDRAILLIGFAGGLRRSEITGLDGGRDQTSDGLGWIEFQEKGLLLTLRGKTGWREVEIGAGSTPATCPITALQAWMKLAGIRMGPLFRRIYSDGMDIGPMRLNDREVARVVKRLAVLAGVAEQGDDHMYAGHSLRAGLASSAEADERLVQKQLGHASAEMTRRYQRRKDRFRVNLTKAAGL